MIADKIFVGRKAELEQFKKVLEGPKGQAVLLVSQRGTNVVWRNAVFVKILISSMRVD